MNRLLLILCLACLGLAAPQTEVAIIAHKTVSDDRLDVRELRDIYSLEDNKWDDGSRIVLFELKGNSQAKGAFYRFLGRRLSDVKRDRLRIILAGEGRAPTMLGSEEEMLERVSTTEGAIGYVSAAWVTDEVKVLALIQ